MNLGHVIGISSSQHLILRAVEWNTEGHLPDIGDTVYTPEKQRIGIIADIFGPMAKPFIAISITKSAALNTEGITALKGMSLFTLPQKSAISPHKQQILPKSSKRTRQRGKLSSVPKKTANTSKNFFRE